MEWIQAQWAEAVKCVADMASSAGVKMELGLKGKQPGHAWVGAWVVGEWWWCHDVWGGELSTHAPTHAWPGLPINPNPILTPAEAAISATHYTAAAGQFGLRMVKAR